MNKFIAEALGTFALVFFGCATIIYMAGEVGLLGVGMAFGLTVTAMVYGLGPISGAHLNPAVSLGAMMAGRMQTGEMIQYWAAQLVGGVAATVLLMVMGGTVSNAVTVIGSGGVLAALIFEVVATFFFVTVILGVTKEGNDNAIAGLAIGLMLIMIHLAGITISGASVNPARSIATNIFDAGAAGQLWLYIIAPLVGGGLAGMLHKAGITSN